MPTYTYDPTKIGAPGVDKMRFELGDTMVDNGGENAAICDEEIAAMITAFPNWAMAKMKIAESIYRRFSYEVTFSVTGMRMDLQQRAEHWKTIYEDLQKKCAGSSSPAAPSVSGQAYFYTGMMDNPAGR